MWNTNVKGVINVSQLVVEDMIGRGRGGCIINVSSVVSWYFYPFKSFCMHFISQRILNRNKLDWFLLSSYYS